jgi:hypothetical protein
MRKSRFHARSLGAALCLLGAKALATDFFVANTNDSGAGSLREAINAANASAGADVIKFTIPGDGPHVITLATQLPGITQSVLIDGYTQAGAIKNSNTPDQGGLNGTLQIELAGNFGFYGLYIGDGLNSVTLTVQGLAMHGFIGSLLGAPADATSEIRAYGNYLCQGVDGSSISSTDNGFGIDNNASKITVGGELPEQRNLLSGCNSSAIRVKTAADIRGNLIGTNAAGTAVVGNGYAGNTPAIYVTNTESAVQIGGANANARNVISGNHTFGIAVYNGTNQPYTDTVQIKGNYIGTDVTGTQPVPNGWVPAQFAQYGGGIGVYTMSSGDTPLVIGGFGPGEGNLIAYNLGSGISTPENNTVDRAFDSRGNSVHGNRPGVATDIDIGEFGPTPNDPGDADTGSNYQQNAPVIVLAGENGSQGSIKYVVDSLPENAAYPLRIDFYVGLADGGSGEWFAQDSYALADAGLQRTHTFPLGPEQLAFPVVATATDANGHTSELSGIYLTLFKDGFE